MGFDDGVWHVHARAFQSPTRFPPLRRPTSRPSKAYKLVGLRRGRYSLISARCDKTLDRGWQGGLEVDQFRPLRSDADACHPFVGSTHLRFKFIPLFRWNILLRRVQKLRWNSIDGLCACRAADEQDKRRLGIRVDSDRYSTGNAVR